VQDRALAGPPGSDRCEVPRLQRGRNHGEALARGKTFFSCNRYPQCKFATWDRPVPEPCPQCAAPFVVEKTTKRYGTVRRCLAEGASTRRRWRRPRQTEPLDRGRRNENLWSRSRIARRDRQRARAMVTVVGGGLAGSEAAWQLARSGVRVRLHEMRPVQMTAAHQSDQLAELVCSNSFRSASLDAASGLLKEEMRRLGSLTMAVADRTRCRRSGAGGRPRAVCRAGN